MRFPRSDGTPADTRGDGLNDQGGPWFMAINTPNTGIDYTLVCDNNADPTLPCKVQNGTNGQQYAARSRHTGGVNACMGDGSVAFIKDSINSWNPWLITRPNRRSPYTNVTGGPIPPYGVYQALSTRNGGEVISSDQY